MAKTIRIAGIDFNANFLNAYMRTIFGESFAHSSLSFEKVFKESKKYEALLQQFISKDNIRYAQILGHGDQDDLNLLKQRYNEIEGALIHFGIPRERKEDEELGAILPSAKDFARFYPGAVRPYRNSVELRNAREAGLLTGEDYETETVYERSQMLYKYITEKLKAEMAK